MNNLKQRVEEYTDNQYSEIAKQEFETNLYHDYFRQIPFYELKKLLEQNKINLNEKSLLIAGCGGGIDVYYIKKFYSPKIFVCDISEDAVNTIIKTFEDIEGKVEDMESLTYEDNKSDYAFVAASLHHLQRPILGLYELLRVSKKGVIVIEPNDSFLTRVATRLQLATEIEKVGNYVYRLNRREIEKISRAHFYNYSLTRCFALHKIAKNKIQFLIFKWLNCMANLLIPSQGNYIIFIIKKG